MDRLGPRDARWYLWVPAIGLATSVPVLVAFLLWPEAHVIAMPRLFAGTGFDVLPVALIWSVLGSVLGGIFTAPFMSTIQSVAPLRMRAFAASVSTLISTLIGLAGGPLLVGVIADALAAEHGRDALRDALLAPTALPPGRVDRQRPRASQAAGWKARSGPLRRRESRPSPAHKRSAGEGSGITAIQASV